MNIGGNILEGTFALLKDGLLMRHAAQSLVLYQSFISNYPVLISPLRCTGWLTSGAKSFASRNLSTIVSQVFHRFNPTWAQTWAFMSSMKPLGNDRLISLLKEIKWRIVSRKRCRPQESIELESSLMIRHSRRRMQASSSMELARISKFEVSTFWTTGSCRFAWWFICATSRNAVPYIQKIWACFVRLYVRLF